MITLIMPYYNNPGMLKKHIEVWGQYENKKDIRLILVDDCSKQQAIDVFNEHGIPLQTQVYRILVDIPWNWIGARNLAMTHAKGWCLMTDIDHVLMPEDFDKLLNFKPESGKAYVPQRKFSNGTVNKKRHPNTFLIENELFWGVGGYDESFSGWYGTDFAFRQSIIDQTVETDEFALTLYSRKEIKDASTTEFGRKDSKYHIKNNQELNKRKHSLEKPIKPLNFPWERQL
jgi:phage anti-repressor protein